MNFIADDRELNLKTRVAWLYHMEGLTQEAIAEKLEISRAPKLVLASGGWRKVTCILAAIRLLHPTVFITDEGAAEGLLARADEVPEWLKA